MFMVCVGLVFGSKNMQFHIICSFYNSISINTTEVDPYSDKSDSLHNGIVKPKNSQLESFRKSLTPIIAAIKLVIMILIFIMSYRNSVLGNVHTTTAVCKYLA